MEESSAQRTSVTKHRTPVWRFKILCLEAGKIQLFQLWQIPDQKLARPPMEFDGPVVEEQVAQ
ncbi:hypothetical protein COCSUDRAFT_33837 [Coccomyxa subellipsoidea C-169]|uniref:Uncharacterized protein n=1 Tax=Coccomyxa subellipsoidea (strain C-169) TaxID=574566 RepID=I0YS76_COCSC|nr:hypothetical protein COCSUDRAFT_33837 [Coccomyxa subellipsoidea C-169]EIE21245.1 hypothetical protein COCSUDRAFT_33837 [Coccomyxa subellipsoidea C-169]|eukprot:XP_005645789.1 hypothetical protein COCSUDRAFT_33837 [Coccomyxa subellipsoidea C-169]